MTAHLCWFTQERWSRQAKRQLWMCLHRLWHFEQETEGLEGPWCVFFSFLLKVVTGERGGCEMRAAGSREGSEVWNQCGLQTLGGWLLTGWRTARKCGFGLGACQTHLEDLQGASDCGEKCPGKMESSLWSMVYVTTWKQMVNLSNENKKEGVGNVTIDSRPNCSRCGPQHWAWMAMQEGECTCRFIFFLLCRFISQAEDHH